MSPHRAAIAQSMFSPAVSSAGTAASVGGTLVVIATGLHAWLLFAVLLAMAFELMTYPNPPRRARAAAAREYNEIKSKGRRLLVPIFCFVLDGVLIAAARAMGMKGPDVTLLQHGVLSASALAWLLKVEGKMFLANLRRTEGEDAIPPGVEAVLDGLPGKVPHLPSTE